MSFSGSQLLEWQLAVRDLDTVAQQKRERQVLVSELGAVRPGNRVFVQRTSGSVYFRQEPSEALAEQKGRLAEVERRHDEAQAKVQGLQQKLKTGS